MPRFQWNPDYSVVQMDGFPIPMAGFISFVHLLLEESERRLRKALQGLEFPEFEEVVSKCMDLEDTTGWIMDDLQNISPGYSFVNDKRNQFHRFSRTFCKALMSERSQFYVRFADGSIHFKRSASFLCDVFEILKANAPQVRCTNSLEILRNYTTSSLRGCNSLRGATPVGRRWRSRRSSIRRRHLGGSLPCAVILHSSMCIAR
jgi:hypothetical protein